MDIKKTIISYECGRIFEWNKWREQIPFIEFPNTLQVKIIPPFGGAIVRFGVKKRGYTGDLFISVYLDCYDILGIYGTPYWEVYPYKDDIRRIEMNNTSELMDVIIEAVNDLKENEKCLQNNN